MNKKLIGITGNQNALDPNWNEFMRDYAPHGYVDGIQKIGHLPIVIPIADDLALAEAYIEHLDGVIFTGGQDVNPILYGREPSPHLRDVYPPRDRWEQALFTAATKKNIPIMGICRGFQLINILLGGTVYQDLADFPVPANHAVQHIQERGRMIYPHHSISLQVDSIIADLFSDAEKIAVNTYHHQVIEELAPILTATAWATDGVVEAFETNDKSDYRIIGLQWHPELMLANNNQHIEVFKWFNQF